MPFNSAKYLVDTAVFKRFRCAAGLSPVYREGQEANTRVKLILETDRRINRESPPDLQYTTTEKVLDVILATGKTVNIDVSIAPARTLIVSALGVPVKGRYPFPHIVIAGPVLVKKR